VGSRSLAFVADNQAFSLAPFLAAPSTAMASNTQHVAAGRGRMVASDLVNVEAHSGAALEVARYYFDATPFETHYYVSPIVSILEWVPSMEFTVLIETETTAGAFAASDTRVVTWTRPENPAPNNAGFGAPGNLDWPVGSELAGSQTFNLGWLQHDVNPALPTTARLLKVTLSADGLNMDPVEYVSRGCAAWGFRQ